MLERETRKMQRAPEDFHPTLQPAVAVLITNGSIVSGSSGSRRRNKGSSVRCKLRNCRFLEGDVEFFRRHYRERKRGHAQEFVNFFEGWTQTQFHNGTCEFLLLSITQLRVLPSCIGRHFRRVHHAHTQYVLVELFD